MQCVRQNQATKNITQKNVSRRRLLLLQRPSKGRKTKTINDGCDSWVGPTIQTAIFQVFFLWYGKDYLKHTL